MMTFLLIAPFLAIIGGLTMFVILLCDVFIDWWYKR